MMIVPIVGAFDISSIDNNVIEQKNVSNQEYTHSVFVEACTQTWCPPCATAAAVMSELYKSGEYDFHYIALVSDMNTAARIRVSELDVKYIPNYVFDGNFTRYIGSGGLPGEYTSRLDLCGAREVANVSIDISVKWLGLGTLKISVTVKSNDPEDYYGYLRTYIVEKESRWNTYSGDPYHQAVIGMPINRHLSLIKGEVQPLANSYSYEVTWPGGLLGFSDIKKDNIEVVAAVYNSDTGFVDQSAAAQPTSNSANYKTLSFVNLNFLKYIINTFPMLEKLLGI
jgi:thiol-disulfide isomerase/thioredoxin